MGWHISSTLRKLTFPTSTMVRAAARHLSTWRPWCISAFPASVATEAENEQAAPLTSLRTVSSLPGISSFPRLSTAWRRRCSEK